MTRYRYSMQTAYDAGERRHPQSVIREHFPDACAFECVGYADCWLFEATPVENVPAYFTRLGSP